MSQGCTYEIFGLSDSNALSDLISEGLFSNNVFHFTVVLTQQSWVPWQVRGPVEALEEVINFLCNEINCVIHQAFFISVFSLRLHVPALRALYKYQVHMALQNITYTIDYMNKIFEHCAFTIKGIKSFMLQSGQTTAQLMPSIRKKIKRLTSGTPLHLKTVGSILVLAQSWSRERSRCVRNLVQCKWLYSSPTLSCFWAGPGGT